MWTRELLKTQAKDVLRRNYWMIFLACLITGIIGGIVSSHPLLGWILLGLLACCIGIMFLTPYISATDAELYAFVRERSIAQNIATTFELQGFPGSIPPGDRQPS